MELEKVVEKHDKEIQEIKTQMHDEHKIIKQRLTQLEKDSEEFHSKFDDVKDSVEYIKGKVDVIAKILSSGNNYQLIKYGILSAVSGGGVIYIILEIMKHI